MISTVNPSRVKIGTPLVSTSFHPTISRDTPNKAAKRPFRILESSLFTLIINY